jgi:parallel beta-helix repeat protein
LRIGGYKGALMSTFQKMSSKSKISILTCLLLIVFICVYSAQIPSAHSWSWDTHRYIENNAEYVFSDNSFFSNHHSTLYAWCIMPDQVPNFMPDGGGNSDWHFLDGHSYNPLVYSGGELPWAMEWIFDNIVQYLKNGNWDTATQLMGAICHFTGDATMPLHSTWNYTPGGNHGNFEGEVNNHLGEISIPDNYVPQELDNIFDATMATLEESFRFTREGSNGGVNLTDFLDNNIFWNDWIKSMTENRLMTAVQFSANVWYTAMIDAGLTIQAPTLISPSDGSDITNNTPTFTWTSVDGVSSYDLQLALDNDFTAGTLTVKGLSTTAYTLVEPLAGGEWYWRVRTGDNSTDVGLWSQTRRVIVLTPNFEVAISPSYRNGMPEATLEYSITVKNIGILKDNYYLTVGDDAGWSLILSDNLLENVQPGENKAVTLNVTVPENVVYYIQDNITVTAVSVENTEISKSSVCIATAVMALLSPPHFDYALDTDDDNLYNYLVVDVNVSVDEAGWYQISGNLYGTAYSSWIAYTSAENYLDVGAQTIELIFDGRPINRSGKDGPYRVDLCLQDEWGNSLDNGEHETQPYYHENFQYFAKFSPPHSDYGLDTDDDNLYNYLVVEANVSVYAAGWYMISSDLYDNTGYLIASASADNYLDVGAQTLELCFDGRMIHYAGRDGPYRVSMSLYDNWGNWLDSGEHITAAYASIQFQIAMYSQLLPTDDAYVWQAYPDYNYGYMTYLYVGRYYSSAERSFLKFDISEIPEGATIVNARYWDYCWKVYSGGANVQVQAVENDNWTEGTITWNNQPTLQPTLGATTSVVAKPVVPNPDQPNWPGGTPWGGKLRYENAAAGYVDEDFFGPGREDFIFDNSEWTAGAPGGWIGVALLGDDGLLYSKLCLDNQPPPQRYTWTVALMTGGPAPVDGGTLWCDWENSTTLFVPQDYSVVLEVPSPSLTKNLKKENAIITGLDAGNVYGSLYLDNAVNIQSIENLDPLIGKPGDNLRLRVTVKNTGRYTDNYTVSAGGSLDSENILNLAPGNTDNVIVTTVYPSGIENIVITAAGNYATDQDYVTVRNESTGLLDGPYRINAVGWYSWNITDFVAEKLVGDKIVSICMVDTGENSGGQESAFESKEWGYPHPYLEITYIPPPYAVNVSISPQSDSGLPGNTLTYSVTVTNTGLLDDNYELTVRDTTGWNPMISTTFLTIQSEQAENATLAVSIPENVPSTVDYITVTATSQSNTNVINSDEVEAIAFPAKLAPPHSDYGLDTDNDNLYNYLVVDVNVEVSTAGWYWISSNLYDHNGNYIPNVYAYAENYLEAGTHTIELQFRGGGINRSGMDGPYRAYLWLYDNEWNWLDSGEYWTAAYTHDQFQPPQAKLAPPHSDYGLDTDNDNLYNYLVVDVNLDVATSGSYYISSSLYDNNYNYITGVWVENYLDFGTQTIELIFDGCLINRSGLDGPYYVYLYLYSYDYGWLDSGGYWTAAYTHENFQYLAKLSPPHSDNCLDTDNDGLYNYLVVEANVSVATSGYYSIDSYLYDNAGNYIAYASAWNYLDVGTQTLELRFKGYEIERSGRDGPYRVSLSLYSYSYGWIDSGEYLTSAYAHDQFQPPPAVLAPPHSDNVIDTDNDGLYNYLVVETKVAVATAGWYSVSSSLYDNNGNYITDAWTENYLDAGIQTLELRFDGLRINRSGLDGPYQAYLWLYDEWGNSLDNGEYLTSAYAHNQFQPPPAKLAPPHSDYGLDADNDNLYNYLVVDVNVSVTEAGWYQISGSLYDATYYNWIAYTSAENYLDIGNQTIKLRFSGDRINRSGLDGPYQVSMSLYDNWGNWLDSGEHLTSAYTYDQFQLTRLVPPHSDYGLDTDNDNLYNYLVVNANVGVSTAGWYQISSSLYDYNGNYIAYVSVENYLDVGTQTLELRFDGWRINRSGGDGPYRVSMSLYDEWWNLLDSGEHETQPYSHENFQFLAKFAPPHSDYGLDTDNDNLYNYLVVDANVRVSTAGWYQISGDLYDNNGNYIASVSVENYLDVGIQTLELRFDGWRIISSGWDGPYQVYLYLYDEWWNWLDSGEHWTATYTHDQFQYLAKFSLPHSDYGLDTDNDNLYNYLVVNANVGVSTAGWYQISGDIYDNNGNYIAYVSVENYLDVGTQTLELRFDGWRINRSGGDGPYRVSMSLYDEWWNLLDSGDHLTAAYTHDQFQAPIWIIRGPIYIDNNNKFTAANGVILGSGTENDPYIIENWDISAENANGIEVRNTTVHFVIRNCYVHDGRFNWRYGIYFYNAINGVVDNNFVEYNSLGILLDYSDNNLISGNTVRNNYYGILLDYSDNNLISGDIVNNNSDGGINLYCSGNNLIENNQVGNNYYGGIGLFYESNNNTISKNTLNNNSDGIDFGYSGNNLIENNLVSNSSESGIYLDPSSNNNLIYHNNFTNNINQAYDYGSNYWDNGYPSGGNYWSDYAGADNYKGKNQEIPGSDGICDTSYNIYGYGNMDRYPLMNPMLAAHTEQVSFGTTIVDGRIETDTMITITTNQAGSVTVVKYENNPGGSPPSGFTALGKYIEVRTDIPSENIVWPIEIRIYYTDEEVAAAGVPENNLKIFHWDGSSWVQEPDSGVNTENNYVWAFVNHLSPFAPMAKVSPQPPAPSPPSPSHPTPPPARDTTPPPTPSVISHGNGSTTTDATPILDWSDVSDPSGVTYSLSIAKDSGFVSIVLEKSGLKFSTYELTSGESLPSGTYYWRVRAVDGAGNIGSWSENWSFTVSAAPTSVVTPPISLAIPIGIVAIAIIAIGLTIIVKRQKSRRSFKSS